MFKKGFYEDEKLSDISEALCIPRSTIYSWKGGEQNEKQILGKKSRSSLKNLELIKSRIRYWALSETTYGYRRVWANIRFNDGITISKNTIYRHMKDMNLLQKIRFKSKFKRLKIEKPVVTGLNQYWQIDMTLFYEDTGTPIYLIDIIDVWNREIVGYSISYRATTDMWLEALDMALQNNFPDGTKYDDVHLVVGSDNGCQPTSKAFRNSCKVLDILQHFSGYKNPKENAYVERFHRTLKEECIWINRFSSIDEARNIVMEFIEKYNRKRLHSALNYKTPIDVKEQYFSTLISA